MQREPIDLNPIYNTALAGIHRAYIFMRFGVQGVSVEAFDDTRLPGPLEILIVPEPISPNTLDSMLSEFRAWVIGNGLREIAESYGLLLNQIYDHGLAIQSPSEVDRHLKTFVQASLREKVRRLRNELHIEGGFSHHFESFTAVRNALTHNAGIVRTRDCTKCGVLAMTWRGIEVYYTGDDGVRYRIGDEPKGMQPREPLETITVDRNKQWKVGEQIDLSAHDLAEIAFMANHDSIEVLEALRNFACSHGVAMKAAVIVRGGN